MRHIMCSRNSLISFSVVLLASLLDVTRANDRVEIETGQGKLSGVLPLKSRGGSEYYAFRGIPFGKVVERFEPAVPAPGWEGTWDASKVGPICPQWNRATQTVAGEEDCLNLNVFTPTLNSEANLPVAVFIHGGAFQFGSSADYGGAFFVDEDVILVTINYRLGAFGFLSTGDSVIQGNMGLKDQNLALKWIQEHISAFGGNKNSVTLLGTSAGAAAVSFQVVSPMSAGLFHRAQTTSGSVLNSWSLDRNPAKAAKELAESLYCPTEPSSELKKCLQSLDFQKIQEVRLTKWNVDPLCQFSPTIEIPRGDDDQVFLKEDPETLLKEGRFNRVPLIAGLMEDEGLLFHAAGILKDKELMRNMNEDWNHVAPITLLYPDVPSPEVSRLIRGFYFGAETIGRESFQNLTNLYSDRYFNAGVKKAAILAAPFTPVYPFIMAFHGDWSILNLYYGDVYKEPLGASHGDDMQYLFDSPRFSTIKRGSDSERFSIALVKLFASFVKTGNVLVTSSATPWLPVSHEDVKKGKLKWYWLDLNPRTVREPFTQRMDFWDMIDSQLNRLRNPDEDKTKDDKVRVSDEL